MDFHVWAKLDFDGRIQSVQSSCTQSPESPKCLGFDTDQSTVGGVPKNEKKLVPYAEKKELIYKMDAKIDEMSLMMTQLAELSKRVKVQDKLIKEYEEKLSFQEKRIKVLEAENTALRNKPKDMRRIKSFNHNSAPMVASENSMHYGDTHRSVEENGEPLEASSCNGNNIIQASLGREESAYEVAPENFAKSSENLDDVDGLVTFEKNEKATRPSSLSVDFGMFGSISNPGTDFETHFNIRNSEIVMKNGYSYARKTSHLVGIVSDENKTESSSQSLNKSDKMYQEDKQSFLSNNEYVDMNPSQVMFALDDLTGDQVPEESREIPKETDIDTRNLCDNKTVQGSGRSENMVSHSTPPNRKDPSDKYKSNDGYTCPQARGTPDYMFVREDSDDSTRPPLPVRKNRSSSSVSTTSRESVNSSGSPDYDPRCSMSRHRSFGSRQSPVSDVQDVRRPSLPSSCCKKEADFDDRRYSLSDSRTSLSDGRPIPSKTKHVGETLFASPASSRITHINRPGSSDSRKDDRLNRLLRDMRTTMEWNEAKKKMILDEEKTAEEAEEKFRAFVTDMYEAFCLLQNEKGHRVRKRSKERLLEKISDKMGIPLARELVSDDLMKKCLDFLLMTCKLDSP